MWCGLQQPQAWSAMAALRMLRLAVVRRLLLMQQ
jgi:hypothetical protein